MADVRGTQWADDAHDKLDVLMAALVVAAASDSPKLSYSYNRHTVANLQLNAVTVDLVGTETEAVGADGGPTVNHLMHFSLRVHTGYEGDHIDGRTVQRLTEGVVNKLMGNLDLGDGYRMKEIEGVTNFSIFEESRTVGGEVLALIRFHTSYAQE